MDPSHPSEPDPASPGGPTEARAERPSAAEDAADELTAHEAAGAPGARQPGVIGLLAVLLPLVLVVGVGIVLVVVTMGAGENPATAGGVLQPARASSPGATVIEAYHPIGPVRLLSPMPGEEMVAGRPIVLSVVGDGVVPPTARARTALVHLTAVAPPAPLTVSFRGPGGQATSSVTFEQGATSTLAAVVGLNAGGAVELTPDTSVTHLAVDLIGWWGEQTSGVGRRFRADAGGTIVDATLVQGGAVQGRLAADEGEPSSAVAVVEVTVTSSVPGTMSLWSGTAGPPAVPTLSYGPGTARALRTLVPLGDDGALTVAGTAADARCRVDVVGWLDGDEPTAAAVDGALSPLLLELLAAV